jgi:hypothetical protein
VKRKSAGTRGTEHNTSGTRTSISIRSNNEIGIGKRTSRKTSLGLGKTEHPHILKKEERDEEEATPVR